MIPAVRRTGLLAAIAGCALAAIAGAATAHGSAVACSTRGLGVRGAGTSGYRVVSVEANGLSCTAARGVARGIAIDLATSRSLSFTDASGYSISQAVSCTGSCSRRTEVAITYPRGQVTVSLAGSSSTTAPNLPSIPSVPVNPLSPPAQGGGPGTVVA